jgi:TonB family protein
VGGLGAQALSGETPQGVKTDQFVVGRHTFFDVGPPNDYYELYVAQQASSGASLQKITLTPAADSCMMPATIEIASASLDGSVADLLRTDPCQIPERELNRERKRCKGCLVFSGANVTLQVQCGGQARVIRSDILDKDMFDPRSHPPKNTSWTMQLLDRLDKAIGQPGVMDKPMFPMPAENRDVATGPEPPLLQELAAGRYDALFKDARDKPSVLYRATKVASPVPSVALLSSTPFQPLNFTAPGYPPLARAVRAEGKVAFKVDVDASGGPTNFTVKSGHALLRDAVEKAVVKWRFPKESAGQTVEAIVEFRENCP